jgi:hypothetical protein
MKRSRIALAAVLLAVLSVTVITAGKKDNTFKGWAEGDKAYSKVWFGPAHASMKRFNQVGFPKRVGLISFYLFDSGTHKFSAMAATYGGTYFKSFGHPTRRT